MAEPHYQSEVDFASWFGRRQPLSGAGIDKGDVFGLKQYSSFLGENKYTSKESYSLKLETWKKIHREARQEARDPILRIDFQLKTKLIVLDENVYKNMVNYIQELEDSIDNYKRALDYETGKV